MRNSKKVKSREPAIGFSLRFFNAPTFLKEYMYLIDLLNEQAANLYVEQPDGKKQLNKEALDEGRALFAELKEKLQHDSDKPFIVKETEAKINRMQRSIGSDIFSVDYDAKAPTREWIVIEHAVQQVFSFPALFAGSTKAEGTKTLRALQKHLMKRLGKHGVVVILRDGKEDLYIGFAASASHQKKEKLVMALASSMEKHEKAIWFSLLKADFLKLTVNGAAIWKMRANLLRPIRKELCTADGRALTLNDIQVVPDIVVNRHLPNARTVGVKQENGDVHVDGPADVEKTMADGTIMSTVRLADWGQTTGFGIKGLGVDGTSSIAYAAKLEKTSVPRRLKPLFMGEGCWKFDKIGCSFEEFVSRANELAKQYPSVNKLYLLREADELEDEIKIRRLTRSLIMQWIHMNRDTIHDMTKKSRNALLNMKTFRGAVNMMSEKGKSEKSDIAKVFERAPWLVLNPCVDQYLQTKFEKKQKEAAANKIRTTGSYPYIAEDLVAVAQIWIFGADSNREDLGVLKADEISVADTNTREVLAVRFPANYQTAAVRMNRPCEEAFASCSGVCMISFYDDILIRQDGDVDGDEICIILEDLAIEATKRMYAEFNPPVVVFAHGDKAKKEVLGTEDRMIDTMYEDLWKAKAFDGVGKYANLATLCAHLASLAYNEGNTDEVKINLLRMSLASTGAILAIDQVKGNAVSEDLIDRLESIGKTVRDVCGHKMPYTQQFVKGIPAAECMKRSETLCDQVAGFIMDDTGTWKLDSGSAVWNKAEAKRSMLNFSGYRITSVRKAPLAGTVLNQLSNNWFNDRDSDDRKVFELIRSGQPIGQKDLLLLLWRNACALEFRMEGETLFDKRKEYQKTVREILYTQACSCKWVAEEDGHVFTDAEKKFSVVNSAVSDALCLQGNNGVKPEDRGSYAIFVLRVFAKEILWSLNRNNPDNSKFLLENYEETEGEEEILYSDEEAEADEPDYLVDYDVYEDYTGECEW